MAHDFEIEPGTSFGEWLHGELEDAATFEDAPWAIERIRRVEARLQAGRPASDRMVVEIPWFEEVTAFTGPGQYIYFSRRLYEVCATEDQVAFIVGHELAHHDLGHVALYRGWSDKLTHLPGAALFALCFQGVERLLYSPQNECDADRHGLDLCLSAGYDGDRCLEVFDILEQRALTVGDFDIVYGPSVDSDNELAEDAPWTTKARIWVWQKSRGYLPLRDRREMLRQHLKSSLRRGPSCRSLALH